MSDAPPLSRRALWLNRLSDEVVRKVADRIRTGELAAGDRLPDRTVLASEFVTSGSVIERAMETLLEEKLVSEDSDGVLRVTETPTPETRLELHLAEDTTRADVAAILELRVGVEAQAAALAADRRTEAQLAAIRSAQAAFVAAAQAHDAPGQADYRFHQAIADASGNPYVRDLTEHLGPLLIPRMRVPLEAGSSAVANLGAARREHQAIVEAIAARDPAAARRAMRSHLVRSLELVQGRTASAPTDWDGRRAN